MNRNPPTTSMDRIAQYSTYLQPPKKKIYQQPAHTDSQDIQFTYLQKRIYLQPDNPTTTSTLMDKNHSKNFGDLDETQME